MSKYTTEVRWICETKSGFTEEELKTKTVDQIIAAARSSIFDFSYPKDAYFSDYYPVLETKILKHYYTREIGAETVGLWKLWLNDKLNLIMPKYNELYLIKSQIFQKELKNIDVTARDAGSDTSAKTSDYTRTDQLRHTNTVNDTGTNRDRFSDTPQGGVSNVENDTYLTTYEYVTMTAQQLTDEANTGTQRNAGSDTVNGSHDITRTETGYRGSKTYMELLADYADNIMNIDTMIVDELSDLFFGLWD